MLGIQVEDEMQLLRKNKARHLGGSPHEMQLEAWDRLFYMRITQVRRTSTQLGCTLIAMLRVCCSVSMFAVRPIIEHNQSKMHMPMLWSCARSLCLDVQREESPLDYTAVALHFNVQGCIQCFKELLKTIMGIQIVELPLEPGLPPKCFPT